MSNELTQVTERLQPTDYDKEQAYDLAVAWHKHELGILSVTWYDQERHLIVRDDHQGHLFPLAIFWTKDDETAAVPPDGTTAEHINEGAPSLTPEIQAQFINDGMEEDALALMRVRYNDTERTLIVYAHDDLDGTQSIMPLAIIYEQRDSEHCTNGDGKHPSQDDPAPDDAMRGCNDADDSPITAENVVDYMMEYENGSITVGRATRMFQFLLDSGMILGLQGSYQRTAQFLLTAGLITKSEPV